MVNKMENKKQLNKEELNNVVGGQIAENNIETCPNCHYRFDKQGNVFSEGSGCSSTSYIICPKCGYRY